jgi:hypothetical protein
MESARDKWEELILELPAYNAEKTLETTWREISPEVDNRRWWTIAAGIIQLNGRRN